MRGNLIAALAVSAALATPVLAHTPYLQPSDFGPERDYITLIASLTEGRFFVPDFPLLGGDFWTVGEAGTPINIGAGVSNKEVTSLDVPLPQAGTWRITTGERVGRRFKFAKVDGVWRPVGNPGRGRPPASAGGRPAPIPANQLPAGTEVIDSVAYVKSETFVTRSAPSWGAVKAAGTGFEFTPVTHPNEIYAGEAFKFSMADDGKAAGGVEYTVSRAGDAYAEKRFNVVAKTDAAGQAQITFAEPGVYVLETRYPIAPAGAPPLLNSTIYTVTLEVTR